MRSILALLLLAALGAAAYLLMSGSSDPALAPLEAEPERAAAPQAGRLSEPEAADPPRIEREEAPRTEASAAESAGAAGEEAPPLGWFRGQLRILSGELPAVPLLEARLTLADDPQRPAERVHLRVDPRSLEFRAAARHPQAECRIELPEVIHPVRASGGTLEGDRAVRFAGLEELLLVEVEIRPHAGVLFLHGTTDEPLAGASAWHRVEAQGSSATYGSTLGPDGLMLFDFERLGDVPGAETITFSVRRPPDVGSSDSTAFPVEEFLRLPRPVVLRFAPTELLRFRVLDSARRPIAGARVTIGNGGDEEGTDAEGRIAVLQSAPPAATVRAEAPGFLTEDLPIEAAAAAEQELMLWPASRLLLTAAEQPSGGWSELAVEIRFDGKADGTALPPERFRPGRFAENSGGTSTSSDHSALRFEMSTGFSREGRMVLDGIHADVPAQVLVRYRGFTVLDERVPFVPGDGEHALQVGALPEVVPLRGRVADAGGAPIAGAKLRLLASGFHEGAEAVSDAAGEFQLGEIPVGGAVRLRVAAAGYAPRIVEHLAERDDPDSIGTLSLSAGYALVVQVLGPDGAPFAPANVPDWQPLLEVLGQSAEPADAPPQPLGPAEFLFTDLPAGSLPCSLRRGFQQWGGAHVVEAAAGRATITLTQDEADWLGAPR